MFLNDKHSSVLRIFQPLLVVFFLIHFLFGMISCTEPPPPSLGSADRKIVDSLYRDSINTLKIEIDSLCQMTFDANVQATVDSIMQERLEEIKKQMKRIHGL